jgi:hypothetical protein
MTGTIAAEPIAVVLYVALYEEFLVGSGNTTFLV